MKTKYTLRSLNINVINVITSNFHFFLKLVPKLPLTIFLEEELSLLERAALNEP